MVTSKSNNPDGFIFDVMYLVHVLKVFLESTLIPNSMALYFMTAGYEYGIFEYEIQPQRRDSDCTMVTSKSNNPDGFIFDVMYLVHVLKVFLESTLIPNSMALYFMTAG